MQMPPEGSEAETEHEALRAVALAAASAGAAEAPALAQAYAELCTTSFAPAVPLPWPQTHGRHRAAGRRPPSGSRERCRTARDCRAAGVAAGRVRSHVRDCRAQGVATSSALLGSAAASVAELPAEPRHCARQGACQPRSGRAGRHVRARRGGRAVPGAASGTRDLGGGGRTRRCMCRRSSTGRSLAPKTSSPRWRAAECRALGLASGMRGRRGEPRRQRGRRACGRTSTAIATRRGTPMRRCWRRSRSSRLRTI